MPDCNQLPLNTVHIQREVEEFILMEVLKCIKVVSKPVQCPDTSSREIAGACEEECSTAAWTLCSVAPLHSRQPSEPCLPETNQFRCNNREKSYILKRF